MIIYVPDLPTSHPSLGRLTWTVTIKNSEYFLLKMTALEADVEMSGTIASPNKITAANIEKFINSGIEKAVRASRKPVEVLPLEVDDDSA